MTEIASQYPGGQLKNMVDQRSLVTRVVVLLIAMTGLSLLAAPAEASTSTTSTVNLSKTTTVVGGQSIVATGQVSSAGTAPIRGSLTFVVDGEPYGTVPLANATATMAVPIEAPGPHTVSVQYSGSADYSASQSFEGATYTVFKAGPTVTATAPESPASTSGVVSVLVKIIGSTVPLTGTVAVSESRKYLDMLELTNGTATFPLTGMAPGSHTLRFEYSGDDNTLGSSDSITLVIESDARATTQTDLYR